MDEASTSRLFETINTLEVETIADADAQSTSPRVGTAPLGWYQGHAFIKKNLHKPATCHHCCDLLWGILGTTGMICEICNFLAHEKCIRQVVSPCTCIIPFLIQDPIAHCWSEVGHFKRKFCNVCRKRLDDLLSVRCEICEYYTHYECLEFVSADCKVCSISTPSNDNANSPILRKPSSPASLSFLLHSIAKIPELQSALRFVRAAESSSDGNVFFCDADVAESSPSSSRAGPGGVTAFGTYVARPMAMQQDVAVSCAANSAQGITPSSPSPLAVGGGVGTNPLGGPLTSQSLLPFPSRNGTQTDKPAHHWREGNLPVNSKCNSCKKTCWSAECLTGMRCEWCGVTVSEQYK